MGKNRFPSPFTTFNGVKVDEENTSCLKGFLRMVSKKGPIVTDFGLLYR